MACEVGERGLSRRREQPIGSVQCLRFLGLILSPTCAYEVTGLRAELLGPLFCPPCTEQGNRSFEKCSAQREGVL